MCNPLINKMSAPRKKQAHIITHWLHGRRVPVADLGKRPGVRCGCVVSPGLNLHGHDFLIRGDQLIAHLNPHLHRDGRFLHISHHVIKRNARLTQSEFFRLNARRRLSVANTIQRSM